MIVFAVHEITNRIEKTLNQLNEFNDIDVLIVDTNSPSENVKLFYENKKNDYRFNLFYDRIDSACYDSGAYIHTFRNYEYDKYYFFQDSIEFINHNIFNDIDDLLEKFNVVAISYFPLIFDNKEQIDWSFSTFTKEDISNKNFGFIPMDSGRFYTKFLDKDVWGIFGPMFSIKRKDLLKIPSNWLIYPSVKNEAMAMERKWAIMFYLKNLSVIYLEGDHMDFLSGDSKYIKKHMVGRQ